MPSNNQNSKRERRAAEEQKRRLALAKKDTSFGLSKAAKKNKRRRKNKAQQEKDSIAVKPSLLISSRMPTASKGSAKKLTASADGAEWACPVCTYKNKPLFATCEMCMTANPNPNKSSKPAPTHHKPANTTLSASAINRNWNTRQLMKHAGQSEEAFQRLLEEEERQLMQAMKQSEKETRMAMQGSDYQYWPGVTDSTEGNVETEPVQVVMMPVENKQPIEEEEEQWNIQKIPQATDYVEENYEYDYTAPVDYESYQQYDEGEGAYQEDYSQYAQYDSTEPVAETAAPETAAPETVAPETAVAEGVAEGETYENYDYYYGDYEGAEGADGENYENYDYYAEVADDAQPGQEAYENYDYAAYETYEATEEVPEQTAEIQQEQQVPVTTEADTYVDEMWNETQQQSESKPKNAEDLTALVDDLFS